jgi:hypothetical protein
LIFRMMIARRFLIAFLGFMSALLGCTSDTSAPRGSIGPESLTVAFQSFPDTVPSGGMLFVGATAHNPTSRLVFARWETGLCGLTVRVFQPSGTLYAVGPPVCRGSGIWTLTPGQSTEMEMGLGPSGLPRGIYRVRAQVEAVDGRSPAIERSVVVP